MEKIRTKLSFNLFIFFLVAGLASSHHVSEPKHELMLSDDCLKNPPLVDANSGSGKVEQLGGLSSYIVGSTHSKLSIILIPDVFGFEAPKLRMLADKVAAAGFYVIVPDFFRGHPYVSGERFTPWIKEHTPEKGFEDAKVLIEALKQKGITKVGAAGFCWGGKVAVELAKNIDIQATVLLHPSYVIVDDIKEVRVPIAILGAQNDTMVPPSLLKQFEAVLNEKPQIPSYVKIFPGVSHGFTIRYNDDDKFVVKSALESHQTTLYWFLKYLK